MSTSTCCSKMSNTTTTNKGSATNSNNNNECCSTCNSNTSNTAQPAQQQHHERRPPRQPTAVVSLNPRQLHSGAAYRRTHLEALLPTNKHFWVELDKVQQRIGTLRQHTDTFGAGATPAGDEQAADDQEADLEKHLQQRQTEVLALQNAIEECAVDVQQVTTDGLKLCSRMEAEEERSFVQQNLAMLQAQWDTLMAQYTQISANLSIRMDQFYCSHVYTLLQQLTAFLADKEAQANAILLGKDAQQMSVGAIRDQLRMLEDIRRELDDWALSREQLNQMGAELCAMPATQSQAPSIRVALADLKQRWARLYAQLRDAQQHLERSLLDMGQLAQHNFATADILDWATVGRKHNARHECGHCLCEFILKHGEPVNYVYIKGADAKLSEGDKVGATSLNRRQNYTRIQLRQRFMCLLAGDIADYSIFGIRMPSESDKRIAHEMSMILIYVFDVLKKQKWAYDANQPASKFLPNSNKTLMDDIEQKANKLSDRVKRELLTLFKEKQNHDKIERCSKRLLRKKEQVVLTRNELIALFGRPVSSSKRWDIPPVTTGPPNFGHFARLEKQWYDEKVVKAQLQNQEFQFKLVEDKRPNIEGFMELAQKLEQMSGEEANRAQLKMAREQIASRYSDLLDSLNARHQQLEDALILSQEWAKQKRQLANFLDESERQLHAFEHIPTDAQKMEEQTQLLDQLQQATDQQRADFDRLVELGTELAQMVSLEEGQELDADIHQFITRYDTMGTRLGQIGQLMGNFEEDIAQFLQSTEQLLNWLKEAEDETHKFDDPSTETKELGRQSDELAILVASIADQGQLVTQVVEISQELCAHTSGAEALSLQFRTDNLRQRYTRLADEASSRITVLEKALPLAEDQQAPFSSLPPSIIFFNKKICFVSRKFVFFLNSSKFLVMSRVLTLKFPVAQADKPAVDLELLRQQLRQQHELNQEIVAEMNGLRDMVVKATKVARELSSTLGGQEGQDAMMAKEERAKRLADETMELGTELVADLEQAFALCKELDTEYTELNEWMDGVEKELQACEPITLGLLAQQKHNNSMLQQIQSQRPMVARNVAGLSELCYEADEQNLKQIAENVAESEWTCDN